MKFPTPDPRSPAHVLGALIVLVALAVGGGSFFGFVIQPKDCAEAKTALAACNARDELIRDSLKEARGAVVDLQQRLAICEAG
jgi:uncharacterized protein HemX